MIYYKKRGIYHVLNLLRFDGSVFQYAAVPSLVCATVTGVLKHSIDRGYMSLPMTDANLIMKDNIVWSSFSFLVGFLIVFRTSMAYNRFWEGCTQVHRMHAEWLDATSAVIAFCKYPTLCDEETVQSFQNILVRLVSMLHALALAEIEESNSNMLQEIESFKFELIDVSGVDADSLFAIKQSEAKVQLVFQWIQQLITEHIHCPSSGKSGVLTIPPPILSRVFQELANGMVCFEEAVKVSSIPFPFPYAQTCDCLLIIHWIVTPIVVSQWFTSTFYAALFAYITVFIFWVLNCIAVEVENPFGPDPNDMNFEEMQLALNQHLLQMVAPQQKRTPTLVPAADRLGTESLAGGVRISFLQAWANDLGLNSTEVEVVRSRRSCRSQSPVRLPSRLPSRLSARSTRRCSVKDVCRSQTPARESVGLTSSTATASFACSTFEVEDASGVSPRSASGKPVGCAGSLGSLSICQESEEEERDVFEDDDFAAPDCNSRLPSSSSAPPQPRHHGGAAVPCPREEDAGTASGATRGGYQPHGIPSSGAAAAAAARRGGGDCSMPAFPNAGQEEDWRHPDAPPPPQATNFLLESPPEENECLAGHPAAAAAAVPVSSQRVQGIPGFDFHSGGQVSMTWASTREAEWA